jgi:hypothetical protein
VPVHTSDDEDRGEGEGGSSGKIDFVVSQCFHALVRDGALRLLPVAHHAAGHTHQVRYSDD